MKTETEETDPRERETDRGRETDLGKGNGEGDGRQRAREKCRGSDERERGGDQVEMKIGIQYKNHEMQCVPLISGFKSNSDFHGAWFLPSTPIIIIIYLIFSI